MSFIYLSIYCSLFIDYIVVYLWYDCVEIVKYVIGSLNAYYVVCFKLGGVNKEWYNIRRCIYGVVGRIKSNYGVSVLGLVVFFGME